jgi:segregation and condensation protein A
MEDSLTPQHDFAIQLPAFEGPLDLLLYLIRRNEVDIYNIPIERVTQQYLEIIDSMESVDLDLAGDFFVMAATLMYIKSRMLLPQQDQGINEDIEEAEIDPRWELVQQLIEYRKFKEAAEGLQNLIFSSCQLIARIGPADPLPGIKRPLSPVDSEDVWHSFNTVLRRLSERIHVGEINAEQVTVSDRMQYLLDRLKSEADFLFSELFESTTTVTTIVATFLAVLELARLNKIVVQQERAFDDIRCVAV